MGEVCLARNRWSDGRTSREDLVRRTTPENGDSDCDRHRTWQWFHPGCGGDESSHQRRWSWGSSRRKPYRRRMSAIMSEKASGSSGESIVRLSKPSRASIQDKKANRGSIVNVGRLIQGDHVGKSPRQKIGANSPTGFRNFRLVPAVAPFSRHVTSPSITTTRMKSHNEPLQR